MKDRNLRKAFRKLVEQHLGGRTEEYLYSVGGIFGVYIEDDIEFLKKESNRKDKIIRALLDYLDVKVVSGEEIRIESRGQGLKRKKR